LRRKKKRNGQYRRFELIHENAEGLMEMCRFFEMLFLIVQVRAPIAWTDKVGGMSRMQRVPHASRMGLGTWLRHRFVSGRNSADHRRSGDNRWATGRANAGPTIRI
jgi:hypothetical protein